MFRPTVRNAMLVCLVLAGVVGRGIGPDGGGEVAAQSVVTPMQTTDAIRGPARGSAASAIAYAARYGAARPADLSAYVNEVYRLAQFVGIDPAIVVAQSALETDTWRTSYWSNHLNPAAIGITYGGQASFTWATGTDAARGHLVHLYLYAVGPVPDGHPLAPYRALDPRYQAAITAGYAGSSRTIGDLTGRWATDPAYGPKIAGRGNDHLHRYRLAATSASVGSLSGALADDLSAGTAWTSAATTPPSAFVRFDLGTARPVGLLRWLHRDTGFADALTIQTSTDGAAWATLRTAGNGPSLQWQGLVAGVTARFIRFSYANPNRDPSLGSLAEVQVFPPAATAWPFVTYAPPPPPDATRATATVGAAPTSPPTAQATTDPMPPSATLTSRTIRGGTTPAPTATLVPGATVPPPATAGATPTATPGTRTIRR